VFFDPEQRHRTAEVLAAVHLVARQSGRSMAEVALQWIAGTGMIDSIIFGARTPVQCTGVLDGLDHPPLSLQQQQYLTEVSHPIPSSWDNIFHHIW
jgi:aryl-alcohol dehydrogenase-like predicted oxidoreductase